MTAVENDRRHPLFEPGNAMNLRHGAYSPRKVDPLAALIIEAHACDPDVQYLGQPKYAAALWAWARSEARVQLLDEWVSAMTLGQQTESTRGQTSPIEVLRRAEASAMTQRARLGLDPLSRARLSKDVTAAAVGQASLEQMMARGAALAAEHEAAVVEPGGAS